MRAYITKLMIMILLFAALIAGANYAGQKITGRKSSERDIATERIHAELQQRVGEVMMARYTSSDSVGNDVINTKEIVEEVFNARRSEWEGLYGKNACPEDIRVVLFDFYETLEEESAVERDHQEPAPEKIEFGQEGSRIRGIYMGDDYLAGIAEYRFGDPAYDNILLLMNIGMIAAALLSVVYSLWIIIHSSGRKADMD